MAIPEIFGLRLGCEPNTKVRPCGARDTMRPQVEPPFEEPVRRAEASYADQLCQEVYRSTPYRRPHNPRCGQPGMKLCRTFRSGLSASDLEDTVGTTSVSISPSSRSLCSRRHDRTPKVRCSANASVQSHQWRVGEFGDRDVAGVIARQVRAQFPDPQTEKLVALSRVWSCSPTKRGCVPRLTRAR
jgi:hypothetical protein